MEQANSYRQLEEAISNGEVAVAREILTQRAGFLKQATNGDDLLRYAARRNKVEMLSLLVEYGADINSRKADDFPEGAIDDAANNGAADAVLWLLEHGATINHQVNGVTLCFPLSGAV